MVISINEDTVDEQNKKIIFEFEVDDAFDNDDINSLFELSDLVDASIEAMNEQMELYPQPEEDEEKSYRDQAVPIGCGQTISQPYVVALMLEKLKLKPNDKVLEIGSGSGYVTALLSLLVKRIAGIELEIDLATRSKKVLEKLKIDNVEIFCKDGYKGHPARAPYDAILLSAAPETLPENLLDQLKPDGKLLLPVGKFDQLLVLYEQVNGEWKGNVITDVHFVPLRKHES
jgi:protein-L-isoaspartate(D-aspartate) O-methyltransferase